MKDSQNPKKQNPSERLLPAQRIRKEWVFKFVFEKGVFARGGFLNLWAYPDNAKRFDGAGPKLGIIVSRKTHLRAVVRNRWKRRIRESFRKMQGKIKPQCLLVISSRPGQKEVPTLEQIAAELQKLLLKTESLK